MGPVLVRPGHTTRKLTAAIYDLAALRLDPPESADFTLGGGSDKVGGVTRK
jgi:hypothetical protein